MHWEHSRFQIWSQTQHPYKHTLGDFAFASEALPGVTTLEGALNYIIAVLYPQSQEAVATVGDLPASGNTLNDYRVVYDDGDGKSAGYRWEQREGEVSPSWHKIYDFDWGADSLLAGFLTTTQDLYVWKYGRSDLDPSGSPITGTFAGQRIAGGAQTGENLTLDANKVDSTGFVQTTNTFRPTANGTLDLGTSALKWKDIFASGTALVNTMTIASGSITDSTGAINFGNENLTTTGDVTGVTFNGDTFQTSTLVMSDGSIEDSSGAINFGTTNLVTAGDVEAALGLLGDITITDGAISSSSNVISFDDNDLSTTGDISGAAGTFTVLDVDNLRLDANKLSATNVNGNLELQANGTGVVDILSAATTLGLTTTGTHAITGILNIDNLRLDGNTLSSTNTDGNIELNPDGAGLIVANKSVIAGTDGATDLGSATNRIGDIHLTGNIGNGTDAITIGTILSFRDALSGASSGMSLFYDGSKWNASAPDTEITHGSLSGLTTGDAGHTQFALLSGRSSGQSLVGGTGASEDLNLESTSNVTKGAVKTKDNLVPFTNASFSGSWSGTDLGSSSNNFRHLYTKGELKGARLENFTFSGLPSASASAPGRAAWVTDQSKVYVDTGGSWVAVTQSKYVNDESFDGTQTSKTVTVSASITDARRAVWALHDNANDFDRIYTSIKAISSTQVTITTEGALPAGSYRLIGVE